MWRFERGQRTWRLVRIARGRIGGTAVCIYLRNLEVEGGTLIRQGLSLKLFVRSAGPLPLSAIAMAIGVAVLVALLVMMSRSRKIEAIKLLRQKTNLGLKEAKEEVAALLERLRPR